jgi:site-specific DNA-methyltransferase (adenine-specific)
MLDLEAAHDYVVLGDNATVLPSLPDGAFQLVYVDPPFNTRTTRRKRTLRTVQDADGDRTGFGGRRYRTTEVGARSYTDSFDDYAGFLGPRLEEARRLLTGDGTLYVHLDYREAHRVKLILDDIFGRASFLNEVIWAYDFGGRPADRWPAKHDTILVYVRQPGSHHFDRAAVERVPYLAPGLVGPDKAARGKLPTDVWWHTIVPTTSKEKTGYPTQKPEGVLRRIVQASSARGARVLDFFAGSGTTGAVARELGRRFVLVDANPEALQVMRGRLGEDEVSYVTADGEPLTPLSS